MPLAAGVRIIGVSADTPQHDEQIALAGAVAAALRAGGSAAAVFVSMRKR